MKPTASTPLGPSSVGARPSPLPGLVLRAGVLVLAVAAIAMMLMIVANRLNHTWDLTSSRSHTLSPFARKVVGGLTGRVKVVIAVDQGAVSPAVLEQANDVLNKLAAASDKIDLRPIDTGTPAGQAAYEKLVLELAESERATNQAQAELVRTAIKRAGEVPAELSATTEGLLAIRTAIAKPRGGGASSPSSPPGIEEFDAAIQPLADGLKTLAEQVRVLAAPVATAASSAEKLLQPASPALPLAPVDEAARTIRVELDRLAGQLGGLATQLDRVAVDTGVPAAGREAARRVASSLSPQRDSLARAAASVADIPTPRMLVVARLIQRNRAVLLLGEPPEMPTSRGVTATSQSPASKPGISPGVVAVDVDALLPDGPMAPGTPMLDGRARGEELLVAALSQFTALPRPRLVIVHGEAGEFGPGMGPLLKQTATMLELRGVDTAEWACAVRETPPAFGDNRPVVWAVLHTESGRSMEELAMRRAKLARAVEGLLATGQSVMVSVAPSVLPTMGSPDPMVEPLERLGIKVRSGRPLLEEGLLQGNDASGTPGGSGGASGAEQAAGTRGSVRRIANEDQQIMTSGAGHPVGRAAEGLMTLLPWPISIETSKAPPPGVRVEPVVTLPAREQLWASSEWEPFRRVRREQRRRVEPPQRGAPGDELRPQGPDWVVAAAIDRTAPELPTPQRVLVIGASDWFVDPVVARSTQVEGRVGLEFPGNLELLSAAVRWLAFQEDAIGAGASSRSIATLPMLAPGQWSALRWGVIGGLPILALLAGVLWRVARG